MIKNLVQKNLKLIIVFAGILLLYFLFSYNSYYFDFDKIEHYRIIKEIDYFDRENDSVQIDNKKILSELLFDYKPNELNATRFLSEINKVTFTKKEISESEFDNIREIFKEQSCSTHLVSACIPVFRDILVFYKEKDVIGIAKICFGCNENHIIGTTSNSSDFGQCGKYEELNKILR